MDLMKRKLNPVVHCPDFKIHSSSLLLGLSLVNILCPSDFSIRNACALLISSTSAKNQVHHILVDLIILTMVTFVEEYEL
jgi:hypothetical protein